MEWLESRAVRPRQARYQAALRPDKTCCIYSSVLRDSAATSTGGMISSLARGFGLRPFHHSHPLRAGSRNMLGFVEEKEGVCQR